jgi:hypothetical protein
MLSFCYRSQSLCVRSEPLSVVNHCTDPLLLFFRLTLSPPSPDLTIPRPVSWQGQRGGLGAEVFTLAPKLVGIVSHDPSTTSAGHDATSCCRTFNAPPTHPANTARASAASNHSSHHHFSPSPFPCTCRARSPTTTTPTTAFASTLTSRRSPALSSARPPRSTATTWCVRLSISVYPLIFSSLLGRRHN